MIMKSNWVFDKAGSLLTGQSTADGNRKPRWFFGDVRWSGIIIHSLVVSI